MIVRHIVEASNVDVNGYVVDASRIKHGTIRAGKVWDLAGFVDSRTHLNLDFHDHRADECIIANKFCKNATVLMKHDGFVFAQIKNDSYRHYGTVDIDARRIEWLNVFHAKRCNLF